MERALTAGIPMKCEERITEGFLKVHFGTEPIYEPLGKSTPPDFSIGKTAFEVRRLNENFVDGEGRATGLEEASFRLNKAVFGELRKIPFAPEFGTFFVGLEFARPLRESPSKIARELARKARFHYAGGSGLRRTITAYGVTAQLIPAGTPRRISFKPGFEVDGESGGYLSDLYRDNIQLALAEKIGKTRTVANRFNRWILVLVDTIMPGAPWADEMVEWAPDLQHFTAVLVINLDGSLEWACPKAGWRRAV